MIRIKSGVSGYRGDGSCYNYGSGSLVSDRAEIERDLVKAGIAEYCDPEPDNRPIAVIHDIKRDHTHKTNIKRKRNV